VAPALGRELLLAKLNAGAALPYCVGILFSKALSCYDKIGRPKAPQMVCLHGNNSMKDQRKRIGLLNTAGSIAIENAKVYKELRRGRITPALASRLSQILINQRVILESFQNEKRIEQLEALLTQAGQSKLLPAVKKAA
jgi:hypothetical protein